MVNTKQAKTQETSTPALWEGVWERAADDDFWWWVKREREGGRSRKIAAYVQRHVGGPAGLKTVEVGSGAGAYSMIFAERGAQVTLLDYSHEALALARRYFEGRPLAGGYTLRHGDAFHLDADLRGHFDLAMSFGTIEHFRYPERREIARAHVELVRPGGVVAISVPNRAFVPHEAFKLVLQRAGKWGLGYEGAFTRRELRKLGESIGLSDIQVVGSALRTDLARYRHIMAQSRKLKALGLSTRLPERDRPGVLDDWFGADLVLLGRR